MIAQFLNCVLTISLLCKLVLIKVILTKIEFVAKYEYLNAIIFSLYIKVLCLSKIFMCVEA